MAGSFLNIPSPEQGASTRILLKYPLNTSLKFFGVSLVIKAFLIPNTPKFLSNAFALVADISFDTSTPFPFNLAASSVLLPPGAAQRSNTLSPGFTARILAGGCGGGSRL